MADVRGTRAAVLTDPTTTTQQAGVDASGNLKVIAGSNSGVDIGDVTINGPLGGGAEAGALLVTIANDSTGVLSVDDNDGALTVDNGGTFVVQENGALLTAAQLIDDAIFADDAAFTVATSKGAVMMGVFTSDTVDSGDAGALAMDANRRLLVSLEVDNAGIGSSAPTNPAIDITNITTPVAIAAGASSNLDSSDLATKKLHQAHVAGSAPFKVIFSTLADGVATVVGIAFGDAFHSVIWSPPHPNFVVSGSGVGADGFRAAVTNLDPADTTDFYAAFFYAD